MLPPLGPSSAEGIVIFNRSHYEDVLIAKVREIASPRVTDARHGLINRFEAGIARQGTAIVKLFLHISAEEQQARLLARLGDPDKQWKFSGSDISERQYWDEYQTAYGAAIGRCSTGAAPHLDVRALKKRIKAVA